MSTDPLAGFSQPTREWFANSFAAPTQAQLGTWRALAADQHALVVAPTGSGKTLAAFLSALDKLASEPVPQDPTKRCRVLYISPLKALAVDVERNLRAPLRGIEQAAARLGRSMPELRVGVRSGDTPASQRRRLQAAPPDILITTPESLFLMLTSGVRETLRSVETVILDEVHVLAGTKRGAHLALSLERLEELTEARVQRIGLSATVRPPERVAEFLHPRDPVSVVLPADPKKWDLQVVVPVADLADPGAGSDSPEERSVWPHLTERLLGEITAHRSVIVFTNSRRIAERLTAQLNTAWAEQLGIELDDSGQPAKVMAASGAGGGVDGSTEAPVIARSHHGSVSTEQRAQVEDDLKSGRLRCVVATSSLELGIDMGAVDLVIQIASPPSVASGLQRVGRAGHHVAATSHGVFLPIHRGDLLETACVVERMTSGLIEEVVELRNPLDVLAQQIVAMCAVDEWSVDALFALVRRSACFTTLPRAIFDSVLEMLSGRYPSEDFAELRPRLTWDREQDVLAGRPGAQRLAATSGGTIPDRGLFGVFLVGESGTPGRRVGELDEEMVHESRVGDVFTLGTTSWRIENITHDQVQVTPAAGQAGRLPFWKGDAMARPVELGRALGAMQRELAGADDQARQRLQSAGLDEWARDNLLTHLHEQQQATGVVPSDRTLVLERFRDELGDWQLCLHAPFGTPVLQAWALAIGRTARQQLGLEVHATATNDGVVVRVPDTDGTPPGLDLVLLEADEVAAAVTEEISGSALFAARFRECAARALLLPRRDPRSRSPLWQQRMRAAQLLEVAARHEDFPIILETVRECLHDVLDLPALEEVLRQVASRQIRIVEVETPRASPFARSLLFGYVGEFVYEGDSPLAERRAAALSLDSGLLAELLGTPGMRQILDPEVIAEVVAELQWLAPARRAHSVEAVFDMIRTIGPLAVSEIADRCTDLDAAEAVRELERSRRVVTLRMAGQQRVAVVEDLPRLLDGLGVPAPPGFGVVPADGDPIEDLVLRWARCHGPFAPASLAARLGVGVSVVAGACRALTDRGVLVRGAFDEGAGLQQEGPPAEFCHHRVLSLIRRRSLAALRAGVEPVDQATFARFLPAWQGVGEQARGLDALATALDQLSGALLPASMVEAMVLPVRVPDYSPGMLDELLSSGEFTVSGEGPIGERDGWIRFLPGDLAGPAPSLAPESPAAQFLLDRLAAGGGWFFDDLAAGSQLSRRELEQGLWELVWSGWARADTFAPLRALSQAGAFKMPRTPRVRSRTGMVRAARRTPRVPTAPTTSGRWSLTTAAQSSLTTAAQRSLTTTAQRSVTTTAQRSVTTGVAQEEDPSTSSGNDTVRPTTDSEHENNRPATGSDSVGTAAGDERWPTERLLLQLDRYGVLTRGSVLTEQPQGSFSPTYRALSTLEERGQCLRGYFVEGLGAAQFATAATVDRLREQGETGAVVLAATDPANAYGAALPWPTRQGHRPGRKPGAVVVLVEGRLVLYIERGVRSALHFPSESSTDLSQAAEALAGAIRAHRMPGCTIEKVDQTHVFEHPLREALEAAGFSMTPQGMRLRA